LHTGTFYSIKQREYDSYITTISSAGRNFNAGNNRIFFISHSSFDLDFDSDWDNDKVFQV
jgi:hypothetical protein